MSTPDSLTHKWLRQNSQTYPQSERVFLDIQNVISRYPNIRPKSDLYIYDDGRTQLLLCLHGLLPISYRNSSYNIPVAVWVTREYPRHPPITYVVPTGDMLVKAGKYVDVSGKCNIEYIQNWERKSEGCNLSALLEALQHQFSKEPPVYAKPRDEGAALQRTLHYAAKPPPPLPSPSGPSQVAPTQPDRPPLPPKPGIGHDQRRSGTPSLTPQSENQTASVNVPLERGPPVYTAPPVVPPPPGRYASPVHPPSLPRSTDPEPRHPYSDLQQPRPVITPPVPPQPTPAIQHPPQQLGYAQPRYHQNVSSPDPTPQVTVAPNLMDDETSDQIPSNATTLSAPPPPRPPNPELLQIHHKVHGKVSTELASLTQALALDADRLRTIQSDLLAGEPAIRDEMARLEAVRDVCRSVADRTRGAVEMAERNITELRRKGDPEVDELVCSTTIVHTQLIDLVAEDNAIEDTIYHLHRALNTGRIDLERFLRTTRVLAEEQFMKRALIEKIQLGMPSSLTESRWS